MTLIELVLVIGIAALISAAGATMLVFGARSQVIAIDLGDAIDTGGLATGRITLDIREMQGPPSVGLRAMSTTELQFLHLSGAEVRYRVVGGSIVRSENGGADRALADGISGFTVTYRRADGTVTTAPYQVTRIEFTFDVTRGDIVRRFGSQVIPRAFSSELAAWREE